MWHYFYVNTQLLYQLKRHRKEPPIAPNSEILLSISGHLPKLTGRAKSRSCMQNIVQTVSLTAANNSPVFDVAPFLVKFASL